MFVQRTIREKVVSDLHTQVLLMFSLLKHRKRLRKKEKRRKKHPGRVGVFWVLEIMSLKTCSKWSVYIGWFVCAKGSIT